MIQNAKNATLKNGVYSINIFGEIRDSSWLAEVIDMCQRETDISTIELRINSTGGYVVDGFSVVSAMLNSSKPIRTVNEGVAASIAAVIFLAGNERWMRDYAKVMIHDPSMWGEEIEKMPDGKNKTGLINLREMIAQFITSQSGMNLPTVRKKMNDETWFTAPECKELGMVEKILTTKRKVALPENSMDALLMATNILNFNNLNMIREFFNLPEDASEEMILDAAKNLQNEAAEAKGKVSEMENSLKDLNASIESLNANVTNKNSEIENLKAENASKLEAVTNELTSAKNELEQLNGVVAEQEVEAAIKAGKFTEADKETLLVSAKNNLDTFRKIAASVRTNVPKITDVINKPAVTESKNDWGYSEWSKKDPEGLKKLQAENPAKFKNLLDKYLN